MIGDSSHCNAGNGTAGDVLLKIAQIAKLPKIQKNSAQDTEIFPFVKEQFGKNRGAPYQGIRNSLKITE
jgi:hypothetical protein